MKNCPACNLKKLLKKKSTPSLALPDRVYGGALTPPMGWSSWNTFGPNISETLIAETAEAIADSGLLAAGYQYVNLDDCWQATFRNEKGETVADPERFPHGMKWLADKINAKGLRMGLYSSNGTHTCQEMPAALGREPLDAYTIASYGAEYFKYDYCHNIPLPNKGILFHGLLIYKDGELIAKRGVDDAKLTPPARLTKNKYSKDVLFFDRCEMGGAVEFSVVAPEEGKYLAVLEIFKFGRYKKFLTLRTPLGDAYFEQPEEPYRMQPGRLHGYINLKKGINTVKVFNPVMTEADSAAILYYRMGECLREAAEKVAKETGAPVKPIVFSICEWGKNKPWLWGKSAGTLWRTTGDITADWKKIMEIYEKNVELYPYSGSGCYNDPDMLEVGNGKLTTEENYAHFALWCMMASPLILGNDVRIRDARINRIVTDKELIAIDQDTLGLAAKRLKKGKADILARPLADGGAAVCLFNKSNKDIAASIGVEELFAEPYLLLLKKPDSFKIELIRDGGREEVKEVAASLPPHGAAVFRIVPR